MTIVVFFIVLAVLVLVHEFGHFLFAKRFGIRVDEFGLGFPPKIWGKKVGETEYTLNWIPFGGFVRIFGENPDDESLNGPDRARAMVHKPRWKQAIVLFGGIFFNFLFAWLLVSMAYALGTAASRESYARYSEYITGSHTMIVSVSKDSPAKDVGIQPGSIITGITSKDIDLSEEELTIPVIKDAISRGNLVSLKYKIGKTEHVVDIQPEKGIINDAYAIGIAMQENTGTMKLPLHNAIWEGGRYTLYMIGGVFFGLYELVSGFIHGSPDLSAVSGPLGIANMVGDSVQLGFAQLLMFTALISINLGVINLVPFPALDGGRLFVLLIESIKRSPLKVQAINTMNTVGFVILLMIMLLVTLKDVLNYF